MSKVSVLRALESSGEPCDHCGEPHEFAVYACVDDDLGGAVDRSRFKPELADHLGEHGISFYCVDCLAGVMVDV